MEPKEFISFDKEKPKDNKWLIVTNNLQAKNAFGEMSHVWLTNFCAKSHEAKNGIVMFDANDRMIIGLTHWKYA